MGQRLSIARYATLLLPVVLLSTAFAAEADAASSTSTFTAFDWRAFLAPFHNVTLHLPIGFLMLAFLLDIYYLITPSRELRKAVTISIIISVLSAAIVVGLGLLRASGGDYDPSILYTHKVYGIAVAGLTLLLAITDILAYRGDGNAAFKIICRIIFIVDIAVLGIAGHYGGNLTHGSNYLVQNAPEWVQAWMEGMDETLVIQLDDASDTPEGQAPSSAGYFAEEIQPIFESKCFQCHGPEKQKGDYRLDNPRDALAAGESELPAIVPFRPRESFLIDLITMPPDADEAMPPEGKDPLTAEEIVKIIRWVHAGAKFGETAPGEVACK